MVPELMISAGPLGLAPLLGAAIGFERQWNQRMAGLRTNALVALGAAGFGPSWAYLLSRSLVGVRLGSGVDVC